MKIVKKDGTLFVIYDVEKHARFDILEFIRTKLKEAVEQVKNQQKPHAL